MTRVQITRLPHGDGLPIPARQTPGSAGYDLASAEDAELAPMETEASVSYTFIGLSASGNDEIRGMSRSEYAEKLQRWKGWIAQ